MNDFPDKKFQVIYADPPWRYDFSATDNRKIENHYPTMSLEEIKALDIPSDNNCILYLWTTAPKLVEGLDVMKAWGFEYKSHSIWDKVNIGMGYWWRSQHEILLVGTKGTISPPPDTFRESSIYREKRTKHSRKPEHYKAFITKAFPEHNKLEVFARAKSNEWEVWGNEVDEVEKFKTWF